MADQGKYSILALNCKTWTDVLVRPLRNDIVLHLQFLFDLAIKKAKLEGKFYQDHVYFLFQQNCIAGKDMTYKEIQQYTIALENQVPNLEEVINMVLKLNFHVL